MNRGSQRGINSSQNREQESLTKVGAKVFQRYASRSVVFPLFLLVPDVLLHCCKHNRRCCCCCTQGHSLSIEPHDVREVPAVKRPGEVTDVRVFSPKNVQNT